MKKHLLIPFLFFPPLLFLHNCYYDSREFLYPEISSECDTTAITFSFTILPIIQENCQGCHASTVAKSFGGSIVLETYSEIKKRADEGSLLGSVAHEAGYIPMPRGSAKLSDCAINSIAKWVN